MHLPDALTDLQMKAMNLAHRTLLTVTGGRVGAQFGSMPALQLHTVGRVSGKRRSVMLTAPVHDGGSYVLVASKGGDDRDPDWYQNLVANPEVELTVQGTTIPMTARTATAEEKAELWPKVVAASKVYGGYQNRTERDIPVVICEPR